MNSINKKIPLSVKSPAWSGDAQADAEEKKWDQEGKLKGQEEINHLWRLKVYGIVVPVFLIVFAILFLGSLASWSVHYLLPIDWNWLSDEQLSKIQSVLFSGSMGAVVSLVAQKHFLK